MIEKLKGETDEDIKSYIESLNQKDLQSFIEECKSEYDTLNQQQTQINTELSIAKSNLDAEMTELKEQGINSIEELEKTILDESNKLTTELTNLIKIFNEVNVE